MRVKGIAELVRIFNPIRFLTSLVLVLGASSLVGKADTLVFHDLSDTVTYEDTGGNVFTPNSSCLAESCAAELLGHIIGSTRANIVTPAMPITSSVYEFDIFDPSGTLSDYIVISPENGCQTNFQTVTCGVGVGFTSDVDGVPLLSPGFTSLGSITEDGTVQTAFSITWSDGRVDTIQFQSDVSDAAAVPEPSSLVLLAPLMGMLGFGIHRRNQSVPVK